MVSYFFNHGISDLVCNNLFGSLAYSPKWGCRVLADFLCFHIPVAICTVLWKAQKFCSTFQSLVKWCKFYCFVCLQLDAWDIGLCCICITEEHLCDWIFLGHTFCVSVSISRHGAFPLVSGCKDLVVGSQVFMGIYRTYNGPGLFHLILGLC